jgi:AraC-like DNA-binding protein
MNCYQVRNSLDEGDLRPLQGIERLRVEAHLSICRTCEAESNVQERLSSSYRPTMPPGLLARTRVMVAAKMPQSWRSFRLRNPTTSGTNQVVAPTTADHVAPSDAANLAQIRDRIQSTLTSAFSSAIGPRTRIQKSIHRVMDMLQESPRMRLTLGDVAEAMCLERTYCCKMFREVTGLNFSEWDRTRRIDLALDLLLTSDWEVARIGRSIGYPDVTTFERNFRKVVGMCPTKARHLKRRGRPAET